MKLWLIKVTWASVMLVSLQIEIFLTFWGSLDVAKTRNKILKSTSKLDYYPTFLFVLITLLIVLLLSRTLKMEK